jgi:formylmethanofuran dehydrogenase subunit C
MSKITLTLKESPEVPLEAEALTPDLIAPLSHDQVCALPVMHGKRQCRLDDFFTVDGGGADELELHGDLGRVKWIGRGMTQGRLKVVGNAGMHLGAFMKGGSIEVTGNASDWAGAEMRGGMIRIRGQAGGQIGAAYRGSMSGMNGGTILVDGGAGMEVGMRMKRGLIAVGGPVRDFAGLQMKGGTIVLLRGGELRTGAWMMRGTIVTLQPVALLPTFSRACTYLPTFLRVYAKHLAGLGLSLPLAGGAYDRYVGDGAMPGKGEILVWQPSVTGSLAAGSAAQ